MKKKFETRNELEAPRVGNEPIMDIDAINPSMADSNENEINHENSSTENEKEVKPLLFPQIRCAMTAAISQFICGSVNGWSGSALTKLDDDFTMHSTEYSLVASATTYGSLIGSLICGKALDFFGRKRLMLMICPLTTFGWTIIGIATNLYLVYFGRFVCGLAIGFLFNCSYIYVSETCEAYLRGRLTIISTFVLSLGVLAAFALPGLFSWRTSAFLFIIPNVIFFIALCFVPESPYWYLLKGDERAASESLSILRGPNYNIENDLKTMSLKVKEVNTSNSYKELLNKRSLMPLCIALFVQTVQQFAGANVVLIYLTKVLNSAVSSTDPYIAAIYVGISQTVGTLVSPFLIDKYGRRTLLIVSGLLISLLALTFGGYFLSLNAIGSWPAWIPLAILIGLGFSYSLGVRPIPLSYPSEIFNTSARSVGCSVTFFYNRLLSVVFIQVYPYTAEKLGNSTIFFTFGILGLLCVVGTFLFVPETKGKTLEEIQDYFEKRTAKGRQAEVPC